MIKNYINFINESDSTTPFVSDILTRSWLSNPEFKKIHIKNIGDILQSVYQPIGNWKRKSESGFFGVMDLEWDNERWSILNRINTNYIALAIIINYINKALANSRIPMFNFTNLKFGSIEFYDEYNRLVDFMKKNSTKLFLKKTEEDGSNTINAVVSAIRGTKSAGDVGEKIVVDYLPKLNPNISNIRIPEGSGDATDMIGGSDVIFDFGGKTFTIQVKRVKNVLNKDGKYITSGASISKHYKTNYYAILDRSNLFFFNNKENGIELKDGELVVDATLLIRRFSY